MKILVLGIGNILFGDEGVGVHLTNLIDEKYEFLSDEHTVTCVDGGTTAQLLIPIIAEYDYVIMIDCVDVIDGSIGDVFFFDFADVPEAVTWQGSAHEIEMLQTLQMMDILGDRPPVKICGVVPFVIGENTTFEMTEEVINGSKIMENKILSHLKELGVEAKIKNDTDIVTVSKTSYKRNAL